MTGEINIEMELENLAVARDLIEEVQEERRAANLRNSGGYFNAIIQLIDNAQRKLSVDAYHLDGVEPFDPSDTDEDYDEDSDELDDYDIDFDIDDDEESEGPADTGVIQAETHTPKA